MLISRCGSFYLISSSFSVLRIPSIVKIGICSIHVLLSAFFSDKSLSFKNLGSLSRPVACILLSRYLFLLYAAYPVVLSLAILFGILMSLDKLKDVIVDLLNCKVDRYAILKLILLFAYIVCIVISNVYRINMLATTSLLLDIVFLIVSILSIFKKPDDEAKKFLQSLECHGDETTTSDQTTKKLGRSDDSLFAGICRTFVEYEPDRAVLLALCLAICNYSSEI